ncbi:heat shock transcription factor 4 [Fistulifera solaris]|uniref:Heat shock transcription factor 4 n=1 Tax=Fistulifera solaris TaxID=1519565 RepID=A0A1Z5JB77_FISSO|nr:heat shock transcription factor 4 [Fistulifera solaris]|eukprot:GAX11250.1 heat shock transcription factor 4 [Fistulifera solaris]
MSEDNEKTNDAYVEMEATKLTCDVLCSLIASSGGSNGENGSMDSSDKATKTSKRSCPKQLQLPLFLSKTYHMIDKCDQDVACWSESGDNFVVKDVDKFSCTVLPLYFKHSNFSSFARQLNFYGFRKLRSEAILTSELDPRTADYIRFYHEHFQRGKPQLLSNIKRATKAEQHSKDDLESLKQEVLSLREELQGVKSEYNRKITELSNPSVP